MVPDNREQVVLTTFSICYPLRKMTFFFFFSLTIKPLNKQTINKFNLVKTIKAI